MRKRAATTTVFQHWLCASSRSAKHRFACIERALAHIARSVNSRVALQRRHIGCRAKYRSPRPPPSARRTEHLPWSTFARLRGQPTLTFQLVVPYDPLSLLQPLCRKLRPPDAPTRDIVDAKRAWAVRLGAMCAKHVRRSNPTFRARVGGRIKGRDMDEMRRGDAKTIDPEADADHGRGEGLPSR